jgi:hypothetical protein
MISPSIKTLAYIGFQSGGLAALMLRSSQRSPTRCVLVLHFSHLAGAQRCARRIAARIGYPVKIRHSSSEWDVSVPYYAEHWRRSGFAFQPQPVTGGVRGLANLLAHVGAASS